MVSWDLMVISKSSVGTEVERWLVEATLGLGSRMVSRTFPFNSPIGLANFFLEGTSRR